MNLWQRRCYLRAITAASEPLLSHSTCKTKARDRLANLSGCTLLLLLSVSGCSAGSGEGLDISGRPLSEGGNVPLAANLESIQANVFNPFCVVCHSGAAAPQGLRLDTNSSFANLVGVPSREVGSLFRVSPGNPDQSYLVQKLEGNAAEGQQMPLGGPPLAQSTINFVRQWIAEGALPQSGPSGSPPVVVSITPDHESTVSEFPAQILIAFDQEVDASTVNPLTFLLSRSGNDGDFTNGNEIAITLSSIDLSNSNARLAVMDLAGVPPLTDAYRIVIKGTGANVVLGLGGATLDGEFPGAFPSGDDVEGGDFVSIFTVSTIQPTISSIQNEVFTPICSRCHTGPPGPTLPAGMDLSSESASFDSLVNVASIQQPGVLRVAPGDPDNSYLIHKLEGTAATGSRMPQGGPFLEQATVASIRQWIGDGANP